MVWVLEGVEAEGVCRCRGGEVLLWAPEERSGWRVRLQEAGIAQRQASRAVDHYPVLIVAGGLYSASSVPLGWVVALLVLKEHLLTNGQQV